MEIFHFRSCLTHAHAGNKRALLCAGTSRDSTWEKVKSVECCSWTHIASASKICGSWDIEETKDYRTAKAYCSRDIFYWDSHFLVIRILISFPCFIKLGHSNIPWSFPSIVSLLNGEIIQPEVSKSFAILTVARSWLACCKIRNHFVEYFTKRR